MGILDMLLWVADENAQEVREKERSRRQQHVTAGQLEKRDWDALTAKVRRRQQLLGDVLDGEEDDGEALELVVAALAAGKGPLTVFEVMRQLQRFGLLSLEFPAAARQQTLAMLSRLRVANRVWQDPHGRWSLL